MRSQSDQLDIVEEENYQEEIRQHKENCTPDDPCQTCVDKRSAKEED